MGGEEGRERGDSQGDSGSNDTGLAGPSSDVFLAAAAVPQAAAPGAPRRGRVLVAGANESATRRFLDEGWEVHTTGTVESALDALSEPVDGVIVAEGLLDSAGRERPFRVITEARRRWPRAALMLVTIKLRARSLDRAQSMDVHYVQAPPRPRNVRSFLQRCVKGQEPTVDELVAKAMRDAGLTPGEGKVVDVAVESAQEKHIASVLGIGVDGVHSHARAIRKRMGVASLDDAVIAIRRAALRRR